MKKERMRLWLGALLVLTSALAIRSGEMRHRRDLLDLADMFDLLTGLDPSDYIPYGNWCGYGGQGKAIDLIDECCQMHDSCYGDSENICGHDQIHVVQYTWKIDNDTILCGEDESSCESSVCTCDKEVVRCINRHSHMYSEHYRFIRKFR